MTNFEWVMCDSKRAVRSLKGRVEYNESRSDKERKFQVLDCGLKAPARDLQGRPLAKLLGRVEQVDAIDCRDYFTSNKKFFEIIAAVELVIAEDAFPKTAMRNVQGG